jgi:serine/threonine protein phosphatase 1
MEVGVRILAIGDLHGCSAALDALLAAVKPTSEDVIITLGDYVDRGPDSKGVIDRLLALQQTHELVPIIGNHDQMMLDARDGRACDWLVGYGLPTLASYARGGGKGSLDDVPDAHWDFLTGCRDLHETATHVFVHANLHPELDLDEQPPYVTRWESLRASSAVAHRSGKTMVCGHTSQKTGKPLNLGHAICIDTYAHGGGWLTCLDAVTGQVWQASQQGRVQTAWIDEFQAS